MQLPPTARCSISFSLRRPALLIGLALSGGAAHCSDVAPAQAWTFGGFGSLGVVHSSERQADFTSSVLKDSGAGHSGAWSPHVDSRLGAQLGLAPDKQWSAVLQVVSEQRDDRSYAPVVEWANIQYRATPELSLRLGRIALPMFLAADYRKVGYAYPWARPPVEVYGAMPITNSDGADLTYRWQHGAVKHVTQAFLGSTHLSVENSYHFKANRLAGFSNTAELGALSARISMLTADVSLDAGRPLFDAFRRFGPHGAALSERYEVNHKRATVVSLGASYDPGSWFAMGELGHLQANSFLGETTVLYASSGYRFGNFTPYLAYGRVEANSPIHDPGLDPALLPPALAATARGMNGMLNELLRTTPAQSSITAGARWDVRPGIALKLQYDRVQPRNGSRGTLIHTQPGFRSGQPVHLASAVLDFVF